jgi:MerR family transcriptional regulator, light-induced transcriptional regulator
MGQLNSVGVRPDLDGQPVYNIKAVVAATGLPAATLRAWERRYSALSPTRNGKGYRLYTGQDIAVLRWLKARTEEGMSISQAIELMAQRRKPAAPPPTSSHSEPPVEAHGQGIVVSRQALLDALIQFDEAEADRVIGEAYAMYGPEAVGEHLIAPVLVQVGERWHRGNVTVAMEHFSSNYLRRKLDALINAAPSREHGPLIVLGCAPNDWHEMGVLLFYLILRRRGLNVLYLGQNVPVEQFAEEMRRLCPAVIVISAATVETVSGLIELAQSVQALKHPQPVFGFGGGIFNHHPELRDTVPGVFLGERVHDAVEMISALVAERAPLYLGLRGPAQP